MTGPSRPLTACRSFPGHLGILGLLVALAVPGAVGCQGGAEVHHERGAGNHRTALTPVPPASGGGPAHTAPTPPSPRGETVTVVETPVEVEAPEVDLELRVRNAYGHPAECLGSGAVPTGVTDVTIRLNVSLTSTGTVTRATATSPGLSAAARACLQARADRMSVPGPIPDAPRTVATSLELRAAAPVVAEAPDVVPERPLPPGAAAPEVVLPAVAGDGPAPGSVAPAVTLPAVVGSGPAAGSRAPAAALPARGGSGRWVWIESSAEARGEVADNWDDD